MRMNGPQADKVGSGAVEFHPHKLSRAPFSSAVRVGDTIYLSGQIGLDANNKLPPEFADQAHNTMDNIADVLRSLGAEMRDIVKCTVMLVDMDRWQEFNAIYLEYFERDRLPARSAFGATKLAAGALMEVECVVFRTNA